MQGQVILFGWELGIGPSTRIGCWLGLRLCNMHAAVGGATSGGSCKRERSVPLVLDACGTSTSLKHRQQGRKARDAPARISATLAVDIASSPCSAAATEPARNSATSEARRSWHVPALSSGIAFACAQCRLQDIGLRLEKPAEAPPASRLLCVASSSLWACCSSICALCQSLLDGQSLSIMAAHSR
jgi:hypothetical protein